METTYLCQLICVIFVARTLTATQDQSQHEFEAIANRLAAKNTLNYNDSCSYRDEKRRVAIAERMLKMVYNVDFHEMPCIASNMDQLVKSGRQFCNETKNLQCTSAGICGCARGQMMGLRVHYIRENDTCRLETGSACAPMISFQSIIGTQTPDLTCQHGSKCVLVRGKSPCTKAGLQNHLLESFGGAEMMKSNPSGFLDHTKKKMEEGICVCAHMSSAGYSGFTSITPIIMGLIILGLGNLINFNS